jgi:hypothetical protein
MIEKPRIPLWLRPGGPGMFFIGMAALVISESLWNIPKDDRVPFWFLWGFLAGIVYQEIYIGFKIPSLKLDERVWKAMNRSKKD